jgi:hypothetical protein
VHSISVDGLHWHRRISVEAIEVLHWRRVMWVVTILVPSSMVVKRFLVMVFVVHL